MVTHLQLIGHEGRGEERTGKPAGLNPRQAMSGIPLASKEEGASRESPQNLELLFNIDVNV